LSSCFFDLGRKGKERKEGGGDVVVDL